MSNQEKYSSTTVGVRQPVAMLWPALTGFPCLDLTGATWYNAVGAKMSFIAASTAYNNQNNDIDLVSAGTGLVGCSAGVWSCRMHWVFNNTSGTVAAPVWAVTDDDDAAATLFGPGAFVGGVPTPSVRGAGGPLFDEQFTEDVIVAPPPGPIGSVFAYGHWNVSQEVVFNLADATTLAIRVANNVGASGLVVHPNSQFIMQRIGSVE